MFSAESLSRARYAFFPQATQSQANAAGLQPNYSTKAVNGMREILCNFATECRRLSQSLKLQGAQFRAGSSSHLKELMAAENLRK